MMATRITAAILAVCSIAMPTLAQNAKSTALSTPAFPLALPPPDAIPGYLDLVTGQFTPLPADTTRLTIIDKVYTFTPNFSQIGPGAALIHTISCDMAFPIVSNGGYPNFSGYAIGSNEFDPENPPTALSIRVYFTSLVPNPNATIYLRCDATDDNNENHIWTYYASPMPIDKLPTSYTNAVIF
jgi:hypothetical protein